MPPKIHVVINRKGGVGKTTLAVNLAATVASVLGGSPEDCPVLVTSIDPQASSVWWAERGEGGGALLPFDFEQIDDESEDITELKDAEYEHVFIDTPGSFARPATLARILDIADDAIIPMIPEPMCYPASEQTLRDFIQPRDLPYRVVRNLWETRDGKGDLEKLTAWLDEQGFRYARTPVRKYRMHRDAVAAGQVVTQYPAGRTATEGRNDFLQLALELGYGGSVT
ncbi:ParA family protein [uncultured Pseudonocardia sp.]|uniref:ParA family protein n=1 Tax=uncultured Pseudonocardia sp. TaxID=211455 RepID=UPI002625A1EA|nr:ParA family protein [uncultured Pseudonocardia sp.]